MKIIHLLIVTVCLFFSISTQAGNITLSIFDAAVSPPPFYYIGDIINLKVKFTTDLQIAGLRYNVVMPTANWTLTTREYASNGWNSEDGLFDSSNPQPSAIGGGLNITQTLHQEPSGDVGNFDFHFESAIPDPTFSGLFYTGTRTVETFSLQIPNIIGSYLIGLADFSAYDHNGNNLFIATSNTFNLQALSVSVVPEPSTSVLFILSLLGGYISLRRRSRLRE